MNSAEGRRFLDTGNGREMVTRLFAGAAWPPAPYRVPLTRHGGVRRRPPSVWRGLAVSLLASALTFALFPMEARGEGRVALVIGNGAYGGLERLKNAVNDARLIARTLRDIGFDVVERIDADDKAMKRAMQDFGRRIEQAGPSPVALFYFAGHGLQVNGLNYLVPINAHLQRASDVEIEAVDAGVVLRQMEVSGSRVNFVILDACRNNPLPRGLRSLVRGLAGVNAPQGSLIAYSTAPGSVALDGAGKNSPYTEALAGALKDAGVPAEAVFRQVRVKVLAVSDGQQVPWESSSLTGAFYFTPGSATASSDAAVPKGAAVASLAPRPAEQLRRTPTPGDGTSRATPDGVGRSIAGHWEGKYQCQLQEIGFSLDITNHEDTRLSAVFEFFPLPGTLSFPRGSFKMSGDYNQGRRGVQLRSTEWIKRPLGFQSHDIEGELAQDGSTLQGRVLTTGCAHFTLTRE